MILIATALQKPTGISLLRFTAMPLYYFFRFITYAWFISMYRALTKYGSLDVPRSYLKPVKNDTQHYYLRRFGRSPLRPEKRIVLVKRTVGMPSEKDCALSLIT